MSFRSALVAVLTGDATLAALLPGGVHSGTEIARQLTPGAFDTNGEVRPCALVSIEAQDAVRPFPTGARVFVTVHFYERQGYTAIDAALARVFALWNRTRVSGEGVWEIRHVGDMQDQRDPVLDCALAISRYQVMRRR